MSDPRAELRRIRRLRCAKFVDTWQELLIWLPALLLVTWAAWRAIPLIDRTAGLDGWGALWGYLIVTVAVMIAAFLAWLITRTYHLDFDDAAERELVDYAVGIERDPTGEPFAWGAPSWQGVCVWFGHRAFFIVLFVLILNKLLP